MDYSAPGTQTDSTKARNPVGGTSDGNKPGSGGQKLAPRDGADIDPAGAPWSAMPEVCTAYEASGDRGCSQLLTSSAFMMARHKIACNSHLQHKRQCLMPSRRTSCA